MLLVSILGDFHSSIFPIFYEFKDKIHTHIVVHDDAFNKKRESKQILNALNKYTKEYKLSLLTQEYIIDEDSYISIQKLAQHLVKQASSIENIHINATDGLSNIGIILGTELLHDGAKILTYDMYENSYNVTSYQDVKNYDIKNMLTIKEHFLLKGFKISSCENKNFALQHETIIRKLFEEYISEFTLLKKDIMQNIYDNKNAYTNANNIISQLKLSRYTQKKEIVGGLFEFYVYLLIKDLGFDDIEIGMTIENEFSQTIFLRNEFDILLMKDNHLHMIECKFTKRIDMQALVYKYSHLINFIDDDGKMIILTQREPYNEDLYDKTNSNSINHHRRALLNKVLIKGSILGNQEQFIDDVKSYFNLYEEEDEK